MKSAIVSGGSGFGGAANGCRSMNAGNVAAGSRPTSRARRSVYGETARTFAARCTAHVPTASAARAIARRAPEPYSRPKVRQSPCSSTITGTPVRATSAAAASKGLCATIASGRNSRASRRMRPGSESQNRGPSNELRGRRWNVSSPREASGDDATTRTSKTRASASHFRRRLGESGRR